MVQLLLLVMISGTLAYHFKFYAITMVSRTSLRQVLRNIGYCPQFDALVERLTGRETLTMFARLRGIPEQHIPEIVNQRIQDFNLGDHADKECWKYR